MDLETAVRFLISVFVVGITPVPWWLIIFHYLVRKQSKVITIVSYASIAIFWGILGFYVYHHMELLFGQRFTPTWVMRLLGFIVILLAATMDWKVMQTLGVKRLLMFVEMKQEKTHEQFVTSGIYQYARHPRYVEYMLIALSVVLFFGYIFMFYYLIYLILSFWLATSAEEKELVERFGNDYREYQKKVPRFFIPFRRR